MPTYQYACTACDERLEAVQSFSDAPLTECPTCSGTLRKVFSAVGVVFKGSGFYKTDSRGSSVKADGGKGEGAKSESGAKADGGGTAGGGKAEGSRSDSVSAPSNGGGGSSASAGKTSAPASKSA